MTPRVTPQGYGGHCLVPKGKKDDKLPQLLKYVGFHLVLYPLVKTELKELEDVSHCFVCQRI